VYCIAFRDTCSGVLADTLARGRSGVSVSNVVSGAGAPATTTDTQQQTDNSNTQSQDALESSASEEQDNITT
jgi:hypothetical protein